MPYCAARNGKAKPMLSELEHDPVVRTAHPRWLQKSLKAFGPNSGKPFAQANNAHRP